MKLKSQRATVIHVPRLFFILAYFLCCSLSDDNGCFTVFFRFISQLSMNILDQEQKEAVRQEFRKTYYGLTISRWIVLSTSITVSIIHPVLYS